MTGVPGSRDSEKTWKVQAGKNSNTRQKSGHSNNYRESKRLCSETHTSLGKKLQVAFFEHVLGKERIANFFLMVAKELRIVYWIEFVGIKSNR